MRLYVATFALLLLASAANAQSVDIGDPTCGGTSMDQNGGLSGWLVLFIIVATPIVGILLWNLSLPMRSCQACGRRWRALKRTGTRDKYLVGGKRLSEYRCKHCGETTWIRGTITLPVGELYDAFSGHGGGNGGGGNGGNGG
jgi:hypothetical protein